MDITKQIEVRRRFRRYHASILSAAVLLLAAGWMIGSPSLARHERLPSSASARINGRITFTADNLIKSINPDGSDGKILSTASGLSGFHDHNSAWSPDGTKIAFSRRPFTGGPAAIWVMDAAGMNQHQISPSAAGDIEPTWSPDGSKIAFVREGLNRGDIFVMNAADGSDTHSIISSPEQDVDPAWSPDGTRIAFTSSRDLPNNVSGSEIYAVTVDAGGNPTGAPSRLTNNTAIDAAASWSPDSSQIAFISQRDNVPVAYVMDANGSNQHNLTGSTTEDSANPVWSPDGQKIAFTNYNRVPHSNSDEIYMFTLLSGNVGRVTTSLDDEHELAWQSLPDGTPTPTPTPTPSPTPVTYTNYRISGSVVDGSSAPVAGVELKFVGEVNTQPVILKTDTPGIFSYNYPGDFSFTITPSKNGFVFNPLFVKVISSGSLSGDFGMTFTAIPVTPNPNDAIVIPASADAFESQGKAQVTVTRTGDVSRPATVTYQTTNGTASQKFDYTFVSGTIRFAANDTAKTIVIPVTDDAYVESAETFKVDFDAGVFGASSTTVTISDNDTTQPTTNPVDNAQFFVRQHYYDFLSRNPDQGGLDYWTGQISLCNNEPDPQARAACFHTQTIGVSAAFFIELEFQESGSFVYRLYKAALGRRPTYSEFITDRSKVIGGASLEASKQSLAYEFVQRPEFRQAYAFDFNTDFVNKLFDTAGLTPFTAERQQALTAMNAGRQRAQVLRDVIEIDAFKQREYNPAFVLMQYFGYLRRNPDQVGYDFWLDVLSRLPAPNNYRSMVCAFITSDEYQDRFSPGRTHNNGECSP